jgi:hypothetical protein
MLRIPLFSDAGSKNEFMQEIIKAFKLESKK